MQKVIIKLKKLAHILLAFLAYFYYGRPARKLIVIGVTGTKGKSTTCRLVASVLEAGGYKVGLLSTVEFQIGEKRWLNTKKMTMLGKGQIQKMLSQMVKAGCKYAVVEVSSEGILQYRQIGLNPDVAVFTNLGTEHQERHGGFEKLKQAKGKLFAALFAHPKKVIGGKAIKRISMVNIDDENADFFYDFPADEKIKYSLRDFDSNKFKLNLLGEFNVYNALAAIVVGRSQGLSDGAIARGLLSVKLVEGRMEFIDEGQPFKVVVDYAHEPLSLTALFTTLRQLVAPDQGKVIAVVGSDGGGRDVAKRYEMGEIAGHLCDYVIISDVNCFDEDPAAIAEMLAKGARVAGKKDGVDLFIEVDRKKAILKAISLARAGDAVAITAKGAEQVICVANGEKIPWDDRQVAREALKVV